MTVLFAITAALVVSGGVLASVIKGNEPVPATESEKRVAAAEAVYERITTDDPAVRAEIKSLYAQDRELQSNTMQQLAEVQQQIAETTEWNARRELVQEARVLKESLELRHIELGLRIAELNGDEQRAADFALALDKIQNPEKYARPLADPSIEAQRKRQLGQ